MNATRQDEQRLAIEGGQPAKKRPDPPMYPGGMMIGEEEERAVLEVLRSKRLFRYYGPYEGPSKVDELERAFAAQVGTRYALAVTSGTAALICALQGIGVGPGDEVIVPAYTWIATALAVLATGAVPVIAEVDETLTLDAADVEAKITPYTRAIIPVHMRGFPCRMDSLLALAQRHGLKVVEDVAQADGASFHGQRLGSLGDVGCFSLQFNKILTAGEGGMVTTNDETVWLRAMMYHDVAGALRYQVPRERMLAGDNYRMPELLAAVMLVQLQRLEYLLSAMRERKRMLQSGIAEVARRKGVILHESADPAGDAGIALVFFMEQAALAQRVAQALRAENVGAIVLYHPEHMDYHIYRHWVPVMEKRTWHVGNDPWRWARREIRYEPDMCPRTLDLLGRAVHLDVSPLLTNEDIEETVEAVNKVLNALA